MSSDNGIRMLSVRRRNILFLIKSYLHENGLKSTADTLESEAHLPLGYILCDNIDLDSIYLEFASYHHVKFGKYPNILRKLPIAVSTPSLASCSNNAKHEPKKLKSLKESSTKDETAKIFNQVLSIKHFQDDHIEINKVEFSPPFEELSDVVQTCLMREDLNLFWSDIVGNNKAIEIIKEAVVLPINHPDLFGKDITPWKSLLLHGPPGCGKTLLAKVLYSEMRGSVCFFNITSSSIISKWRGESEKVLKLIFKFAKLHAPSVIYIDEIEGLTSKRDRSSDHESSKRLKNELLQLLDGIENISEGVFILATTNLPWEIDPAFLRRFEKKILIELPNCEERQNLIEKFLPTKIKWPKQDLLHFAEMCEGFTGDEIRLATKELTMTQIRNLIKSQKPNALEVTSSEFENILLKMKPSASLRVAIKKSSPKESAKSRSGMMRDGEDSGRMQGGMEIHQGCHPIQKIKKPPSESEHIEVEAEIPFSEDISCDINSTFPFLGNATAERRTYSSNVGVLSAVDFGGASTSVSNHTNEKRRKKHKELDDSDTSKLVTSLTDAEAKKRANKYETMWANIAC